MKFSAAVDERAGPDQGPGARLREALEMYEEGVALQRQNFRRRHPGATAQQIEQMLFAWLCREGEV